jgi:DNA relaxase NicK
MLRFDAYSATTTEANHHQVVDLLANSCGISGFHKLKQGKGFHTFSDRLGISNEEGVEWASVMWGGRQGDRVMFEVKGESTPKAVEALRGRFKHRCTRVDSCADFDAPAAFESLLGACQTVKKDYRLTGEKQGDWDDFPELGRTLYLGARSSVCRVRLYEKGKQPEYRHLERPNWTRIELQVRPAKDAKTAFAVLSPREVWGASSWTRDLAGAVLQEHVDPHPAGTTYRLTQRDAALEWMCRQYGSHLVDLAVDLGGWDCVGLTLSEIISEQSKKRRLPS